MSLVKKPICVSDLGAVDTSSVKKLLSQFSVRFWAAQDEIKENNFACFHHTQHIIMRFIHQNQDHRDFYHTPVWLYFESILRPLFDEIVKPYNFLQPEYPKAMFARLSAGHEIDRHIDGAGSNLHTHKIHIPIQTNKEALFSVGKNWLHLQENRAYEVNNIRPHAARNGGDEDRIHLIFEVFDAAL